MKSNKHRRPTGNILSVIIPSLLVSAGGNIYPVIEKYRKPYIIIFILIALAAANLFNLFPQGKYQSKRLKVCLHGVRRLQAFWVYCAVSLLCQTAFAAVLLPGQWKTFLMGFAVCVSTGAALFWNGMICVYLTSVQLGIHHRVTGILCGLIPILNLFMLKKIIKTVSDEILFETNKTELNALRHDRKICATKYPLLLVHGIFFRDMNHPGYWGRIPAELERNGAVIYYGNHQSALSVAESAEELARRIREIVDETGCEKLNIIAHSKGGLDCRYALQCCDVGQYVASLTTVNTPHRGCGFADFLLNKAPSGMKNKIACAYNSAMRKLGDDSPDFLAATADITSEHCCKLDTMLTLPDGVYCQSIGSKLNRASGGKFPLNLTYLLAGYFDGANDGLVSESSFQWSQNYLFLTVSGKRGISHGDMIDLNRENIPGFDVREFYVGLAAGLKAKGL